MQNDVVYLSAELFESGPKEQLLVFQRRRCEALQYRDFVQRTMTEIVLRGKQGSPEVERSAHVEIPSR